MTFNFVDQDNQKAQNSVVFIREEAERLNLNFLETLYHIINCYRINKGREPILNLQAEDAVITKLNNPNDNIDDNDDDDNPLDGFD